VKLFRFIEVERARFPIAFMCHRLGVARSGFYAWRTRPPCSRSIADAQLSQTIRQIHTGSRGTYGVPRVHAELLDLHALRCGRKRVARLMRAAGLVGVCRRRQPRRARPDETGFISDDLVQRAFAATAPDRLWVADIERHEALSNREEVRALLRQPVAAGR